MKVEEYLRKEGDDERREISEDVEGTEGGEGRSEEKRKVGKVMIKNWSERGDEMEERVERR